MFPELVSILGRLMSCWGLWQSATSFYPFTSCFGVCIVLCPLSPFGSLCMEFLWACFSVYVCVLNLDQTVCLRALLPQHLTPPALVFTPPTPISVLVCLPLQRLVHHLPTFFSILPLGRNTEQGWEGCPVPTLGLSHSHRNTPKLKRHPPHKHSVSLHCPICIWASVIH